jgi:peptidoglycan DL-endopeptidase LytF
MYFARRVEKGMDLYQRHEVRKIDASSDEYAIVLYLEDNLTEFANELGTEPSARTDMVSMAKLIIKKQYPGLKVTIVKVILGGLVVASIPLTTEIKAQAEDPTNGTVQTVQASSSFYQVVSGDTLWKISTKFNVSVDNIKRANNLTTDFLQLNQRLIIPKAFHTVAAGDYLTVLAKNYETTVTAIKEVNGLTSDTVQLGRTLIIPILITSSEPTPTVTQPTTQTQGTTYTVVSGDTLWGIAKKFNITVDALRTSNNLTSDVLKIGQVLTIPTSGTTITQPAPTPTPTTTTNVSYTVVSGDTLWGIAKKFNVTIDQIKQANQLTSDTLRIGQVLLIPKTSGETTSTVVSGLEAAQKKLQALGYYSVPTMTGTYDTSTTQALKNFQTDYGIPVTGTLNEATNTAIDHAIVKKALVSDSVRYLGVPYLWGGTTPSGFDCSGFVYYMFNQNGVNMARNTSGGLYTMGTPIARTSLQPGDLVFFAVNSPGVISHVGFYMGDNQFISATSSKGIATVSMDNTYWAKYYVGAKRVY